MASDGENRPDPAEFSSLSFPLHNVPPDTIPAQVPFPRRPLPLLQRLRRHPVPEPPSPEPPENSGNGGGKEGKDKGLFDDYSPAPTDIALVRGFLGKLGLPVELALTVLDYAEYKVRVRARRRDAVFASANRFNNNLVARVYLISPPVPTYDVPGTSANIGSTTDVEGGGADEELPQPTVSRVRFALTSHDQGYSMEPSGTYHHSWSWFDASILRPCVPQSSEGGSSKSVTEQSGSRHLDSLLEAQFSVPSEARSALYEAGYTFVPVNPPPSDTNPDEPRSETSRANSDIAWHVQRNLTASHTVRTHIVVWNRDNTTTGSCFVQNNDEQQEEPEDPDRGTGRGDGKGFVQALRPGDRIAIWARACFPGWSNSVKAAEVEAMCNF